MGVEKHSQGFTIRQPERREDPRYSMDEDALVQVVGCDTPVSGTIMNLSQAGCHLRTRERVFARARRPVEITFKVHGVAFRFSGVVAWTDNRNLLGIRFVNVAPRRKVELAEVICEMEAAAAARAEAVNKLVAEQEAPARTEGEARASAKRQNREPSGTEGKALASALPASPAAPAANGQQTAQDAKQRDRREQARHEVDTFAKILLVKIGSALRGRILDLSLSGCRIRTDERFPVGTYTRVETEFWLRGLPFRLSGVIQAIQGRNTVGVRFLDLSDRRRQQVAELIDEIQQMRVLQMAAAEGRI
jgi:c-di-GMP-binding flagellar brake protein YcgR